VRVLIVDDEAPARSELRYQLGTHPDVRVIGEAANGAEALELVRALSYDVLFLDIAMPEVSGLEFARALHGGRLGPPFIVFVTAHDEHALRAFGLSAVDYLLKPVSPERLAACLDRLRVLTGTALPERRGEPPAPRLPRFLTGRAGEKAIPVAVQQVALLVATDDQVEMVVADGRRLRLSGTLATWTAELGREGFLRCHRSYLVNPRHILEVAPAFGGGQELRVRGVEAPVPVSRKRLALVKERLRLP
jgi:DNA-binding LytR/AlgR family response regulator